MKYAIKNLRSLSSDYSVNFKSITILVGKNSSGKSSFIRSIPLIKQSAQNKLRGNILWNGRFTDFGSFIDSINRNAASKNLPISIYFEDEINLSNRDSFFSNLLARNIQSGESLKFNVSFSYYFNEDSESTYLGQIKLGIFDHEIDFLFDRLGKIRSLKLNGVIHTTSFKDLAISNNNIFPQFYISSTSSVFGAFVHYASKKPLSEYIKNIDGRFSQATASKISDSIKLYYRNEMLSSIKKTRVGSVSWRKTSYAWDENNITFKHLVNTKIAEILIPLTAEIMDYLSNQMLSSRYVGPARSAAQRYYRIQELAVDEIDPYGENIALFLRSLSSEEVDSFDNWCLSNIGIQFKVTYSTGHVSLKIIEIGESIAIDLADVGFGYSQILPILVQLWALEYRNENSRNRNQAQQGTQLLLIEQPELHLHPRMQAILMEIIANTTTSMRKKGRSPVIILETHSEHMINKLGEMIYEGNFSSSESNVYVFNKNSLGETEILESRFSDEGRLSNWPRGFFSPNS